MATGSKVCAARTAVTSTQEPNLLLALLALTKPGIVLAECAAGLAGMLLVTAGVPPTTPLFWCLLCLVLAASGAAMANCVLDAAADRQMPRLAYRSRALSCVGLGRALVLSLFLMGIAGLLAALRLNTLTLVLLLTACVSYLLLYTCWLKRVTPWGVLAGAIPGALPPLIGAAALSGHLGARPLLLGGIIFIWQLPHFWFLALQYEEEYRQAGIPVLSVSHGRIVTKRLLLLSAAALLPANVFLAGLGNFSPAFLLVTLVAGGLFILGCYRCLYRHNDCRSGFIASLVYLGCLLIAIACETLLIVP